MYEGTGQNASPRDQEMNGQDRFGSMQIDTLSLAPQALNKYPNTSSDLLKVWSERYSNVHMGWDGGRTAPILWDHPMFQRWWIPAMQKDPHLVYGVWMLRGPIISKAKFEVTSDSPEIQEWVQKQIDRFWARGISEALTSLEWGFSGHEVIYEYDDEDQTVKYKALRYFDPRHVRPVVKDGYLQGITVRNIRYGKNHSNQTGSLSSGLSRPTISDDKDKLYLPMQKAFWAVHDRRHNRWHGRSRYEGAFIPWYETWQPKGFRNIRHLALYKYSFMGGVLKYPEGSTPDPSTGVPVPNVLIATKLLDMIEAGGAIALPAWIQETGGWDYIPPEAMGVPEGLFMYGESLRDEIWEGIGVPPEVAKSEATGSFAGRRVPQQAFYSNMQEIANEMMFDFREQILEPLVKLNYGSRARFEVKSISILETLQKEEMGAVTGHMPGDEGDSFYGGDGEEVDENGEPIPPQEEDQPLSNGRIEDRKSNANNIQQNAQKRNAK